MEEITAEKIHNKEYEKLVQKMEGYNTLYELDELIGAFGDLGDFKDSNERYLKCKHLKDERIESILSEYNEKGRKKKPVDEAKKLKRKKQFRIMAVMIAVCIVLIGTFNFFVMPVINYQKAEEALIAGQKREAMMCFAKAGRYKDAREQKVKLIEELSKTRYAIDGYHIEGITERNGLVDLVSIDVNSKGELIGIKNDGTVAYSGFGMFSENGWNNLISVKTFAPGVAIGLRDDGKLIVSAETSSILEGTNLDVSHWENIVAIDGGKNHTVGLKANGRVIAAANHNDYEYNDQATVVMWSNIVAIAAGDYHTVGLKANGTVVATKHKVNKNTGEATYDFGQCQVEEWKDIVAIAADDTVTVGLRSDGTVVATTIRRGFGTFEFDVEGLENIVEIYADDKQILCVDKDGNEFLINAN